MQLFCLSFAGGTAAFYDALSAHLAPEVQVVALEYPGHGARIREPLSNTFAQLTNALYPTFRETYTGGAYAFMGYSMGSIAAVEMLKRILSEEDVPLPCWMFLAAHDPHNKAELAIYSGYEADDLIKERTIRFGGVPPRLQNNRSFWRVYLPLYRADYAMIGRYDFANLDLRTNIPATVFYSPTDTPLKEISLWRNYFTDRCELVEYSGSHFFIHEHSEEMAEIIKKRLRQIRDDI